MDSANLTKAKNALSTFESNIGRADTMRYLSDGLDCLDEIVAVASAEAVTAQAIGDRYVTVVVKYIENILSVGSATEPELESAYNLVEVIKEYEFGNADEIKHVAIETLVQLFKKYYTGYSSEEKGKILENMTGESKHRT